MLGKMATARTLRQQNKCLQLWAAFHLTSFNLLVYLNSGEAFEVTGGVCAVTSTTVRVWPLSYKQWHVVLWLCLGTLASGENSATLSVPPHVPSELPDSAVAVVVEPFVGSTIGQHSQTTCLWKISTL